MIKKIAIIYYGIFGLLIIGAVVALVLYLQFQEQVQATTAVPPTQVEEYIESENKPRDHHVKYNLVCEMCHQTDKPTDWPQDTSCRRCHGPEEKIINVSLENEISFHGTLANPHNSPHYGPDLDCLMCHHEHKENELYCAQCHTFDYKVP